METLQDIERLDELADLEARKEHAALLTVAAFFQRAMVQQEKRREQVMMDANEPQEAASFETQQQQQRERERERERERDPFQRLELNELATNNLIPEIRRVEECGGGTR
jgi:hypothetical protein